MVFDPSDPVIDKVQFKEKDWTKSEVGSYTKEEFPKNMPIWRGFAFVTRASVDANHAEDSMTRRSWTRFLVYLNMALSYWTSKK